MNNACEPWSRNARSLSGVRSTESTETLHNFFTDHIVTCYWHWIISISIYITELQFSKSKNISLADPSYFVPQGVYMLGSDIHASVGECRWGYFISGKVNEHDFVFSYQ